ncbi:hypothetical protein [Nocardioides rubriscoriae]|uniref:hypothetical protein n=1 Tax=Nocardioides rubriscoriae TaxID=642762 RepID=UPI0011E03E67|nr:hypothetical protein [Nocardioides rubriscoriae]
MLTTLRTLRPLRTLRTLRTVGALALAALAAAPLLASPATAAGPVEIKPAQLSRGADPATPYVSGGEVVDGDRRVDVPGRSASVLGRSGGGYVVVSLVGDTWTTSRVGTGPAATIVEGPLPEQVTLSGDGGGVLVTSFLQRRTAIDYYVAGTGDLVRHGLFARFPRVLDAEGDRVVVGGPDGGYLWNVRTNRRTLVDSGIVYAADISSNRLASFDKDPYDGGCSQVSQLRSPRELLWASCREAVRAFAPDGDRIVTQHKLTDGLGAGRLWERTLEGRLLASYTVGSHVGGVTWEDDTHLLLDAYGTRRWAVVRCSQGSCERASAVRRTPGY